MRCSRRRDPDLLYKAKPVGKTWLTGFFIEAVLILGAIKTLCTLAH